MRDVVEEGDWRGVVGNIATAERQRDDGITGDSVSSTAIGGPSQCCSAARSGPVAARRAPSAADRLAAPPPAAVWEWETEYAPELGWHPYSAADAARIEAERGRGRMSFELSIRGQKHRAWTCAA